MNGAATLSIHGGRQVPIMPDFQKDLAVIHSIPAVPIILDVVCRTTGMGFAAVARVTESRWIACSVLDQIQFGLGVGGELQVESTICHEIRESRQAVLIEHVDEDDHYRNHPTPRQYGFQSYISMPIFLADKSFFGTLCAIDPKPARVKRPEVSAMFRMFADLIAFHIDAAEKLAESEAALVREREDAVLREQFIAVLGHDLRSPLGAITMGTALLKEGELDEMQGDLVEMMEKSAGRMFGLIDDVMDFARGRLGGGISLESTTSEPLEPILEQILGEMRALRPDRLIELETALAEPVVHDRKRLSQLFTNLLANAVHHGDPGAPVKVIASSGAGHFVLSVSNAAKPIPAAVLGRLFEPFTRSEAGESQQGLGLGLYIASQIAKSHGGTLAVISNEVETRFTFSMPCGGGIQLFPADAAS